VQIVDGFSELTTNGDERMSSSSSSSSFSSSSSSVATAGMNLILLRCNPDILQEHCCHPAVV